MHFAQRLFVAPLLFVVLLIVCGMPAATANAAATADVEIRSVSLGFDGVYKVGYWTPVTVEAAFDEPPSREQLDAITVDLVTSDSDGARTAIAIAADLDSLATGDGESATATFRGYAKFGRTHGYLDVHVRTDAGSALASRSFDRDDEADLPAALATRQMLVLVVGDATNFVEPIRRYSYFKNQSAVMVAVDEVSAMPTDGVGFGAVDVVIASTASAPFVETLADPARAAALDQWVQMGGTLILSAAKNTGELLDASSPLTKWLPGEFDQIVELGQVAAIEAYCETNEPLTIRDERGDVVPFSIVRLRSVKGRIEAYKGSRAANLPLVVRTPYGFGRVAFSALDLAGTGFEHWQGLGPLLARLIEGKLPSSQRDDEETIGQMSHAGYDDLSGQLRAALGDFEATGVGFTPFWVVFAISFIYIVIIAPVDYLVLRRWPQRMALTWITFPLVVILFSVVIYWVALGTKGDQLQRNQVDVVDIDTTSDLVRGTTWITLFSPAATTYDLSLATEAVVHGETETSELPRNQKLFSWLGLPGPALGGMRSSASPPLFTGEYRLAASRDAIRRVPIGKWATKSFFAQWQREQQIPSRAELREVVSATKGLLQGDIDNPSTFALGPGLLFYGDWVFPIPPLQAGEIVSVTDEIFPLNVKSHLTRRTVSEKQEYVDEYDVYETDIHRIVEMLMFYDAVGGEDYTQLTNRYHGRLDMSELIRSGRAVLLAPTSVPASTVLDGESAIEAQGRTWTLVRVVFPVAGVSKDDS